MADFSMTKHYNNYIEGVTRLGQLGGKIENMRSSLFYAEDLDEAQAKLGAAEAEYEQLKAEVDDLRCLASTGKHRAELNQGQAIQFKGICGMELKPHWPGR